MPQNIDKKTEANSKKLSSTKPIISKISKEPYVSSQQKLDQSKHTSTQFQFFFPTQVFQEKRVSLLREKEKSEF